MFSRAKKEPQKKPRRDLSQFGIFDIPTDINLDGGADDDDTDSDMEAELAAITSGSGQPRRRAKPKPQPAADLDRMVAESLRDIDLDDDDDIDEDDPDLLNELSEIVEPEEAEPTLTSTPQAPSNVILPTTNSMPELLKARIEMYKLAEANAKAANDSSKARRIGRGLKTLETMFKQASAGKTINPDEIPPEVATGGAKPPATSNDTNETPVLSPVRSAPAIPNTPAAPASPPEQITFEPTTDEPATPVKPVNSEKIDLLLARQREYKLAALTAKKSGDMEKALNFVKISKMFDTVIKAAQDGQPVDLSDMPPPPNELQILMDTPKPAEPAKEESQTQHSAEDPPPAPAPVEEAVPIPTTILEALTQRLAKYKSVEQAAKDEGNTSKARRFGRIVKQYEDAVKLHKAGKPVPFDELPTPPGFGPIPGVGAPQPAPEVAPKPQVVTPAVPQHPSPPKPALQKQDSTSRLSGNHSSTTLMNKTINTILERQKEFRAAAVEAKRAGEIETAKEYLKIFKGLENLLKVAQGGLPIDLNTLPIPPSQRSNLEDSFTIVGEEDAVDDDISDISARMEEQLHKQLKMCKTTRDHHKALGDVAGTNRFENLALSVQKDIDILKIARRNKMAVPKFHYEKKAFNIVKCNTDLTDNELEINVIRGISYVVANPKDVDTYVKLEFPYPQETPFKTKTQLIRDSDSPDYNEKFVADIQPKVRNCQRVFKRHAIKFEIYSKGGFFRSDTLIGVATVKLQPLETTCEIHDSFDIMDGRKANGGKLEVKIRIKNPILTKQIEHTEEKWLILDS
ncbi:coiled-coil and C2 domain-containing protein 1-like isoform X2 [Bradysia coprophila]|uniref:coiled-coil and C2 domain-containing protein 1-like isoform X2 n=1 Tax=Bradysia coprophila TaxID=38358 RepID=UPI00187D76A4|nr:coiled-coil and C2 domain-containing protein 1-like isoform X2 [Bradysia coprophila]